MSQTKNRLIEIALNWFLIYRLAEVGKLAVPRVGKYETGQFFLHRVFGYRGVILFPWRAKIFDRNTYTSNGTNENIVTTETEINTSTTTSTTDATKKIPKTRKIETVEANSTKNESKKEVSVDVQTYYQVLIDSRDCPHVVSELISSFKLMRFRTENDF